MSSTVGLYIKKRVIFVIFRPCPAERLVQLLSSNQNLRWTMDKIWFTSITRQQCSNIYSRIYNTQLPLPLLYNTDIYLYLYTYIYVHVHDVMVSFFTISYLRCQRKVRGWENLYFITGCFYFFLFIYFIIFFFSLLDAPPVFLSCMYINAHTR